MNTTPRRRATETAAWFVLGLLALGLVTAVLTSAVSSIRTDDRTSRLAAQLADARNQISQLQDDAAAERVRASKERDRLRQQNRDLRRQIAALVKALEEHGLEVPPAVVQGSGKAGGGATRPKSGSVSTPPAPGKSGTHRNPRSNPDPGRH